MLPLSVLLNKIPKFLKPAWGTTVALLPTVFQRWQSPPLPLVVVSSSPFWHCPGFHFPLFSLLPPGWAVRIFLLLFSVSISWHRWSLFLLRLVLAAACIHPSTCCSSVAKPSGQ